MDDKLKNSLDWIDEKQTSDLLEKGLDFDIDKKTLGRIKSSVYKKAGINKKPAVLSRKLIACAAAILLAFCAMSAVGFDNVAATVWQIVQYIPGFGMAPKDTGGDAFQVKVMKIPAYIEVQGEKAEIYSSWISIYKDQAIVTAILRYPKNTDGYSNLGVIALEYNGKEIDRDNAYLDLLTDSEPYQEMTYTYTIKSPKTDIDTLTLKSESGRVEIAFVKSEDITDKVVSQNFNGIIVSAIPLDQDRSKFILTSTYEKNMAGVMFISEIASGIDSQIKAVDEYGNEYDIKKSTPQGSEYYVNGDIKGKIVALKFNKLYQGFKFENNKSLPGIKFKTPKVGETVDINKSFDNSICSINLKTVAGIAPDSTDPHNVENLVFTYEMKNKIPGLDIYNLALYVEKNGGVMGGTILEEHKEGDSYIVKYSVIADENAAENTVNIVPYYGSYYWDMLFLDEECTLNFQ